MIKVLIVYLILINVLSFAMFGIDKRRAVKNKWRISEAALLTASFIGGSVGGMLGMHIFHHKTQKMKFKILMPLMLMAHIVLLFFILYK